MSEYIERGALIAELAKGTIITDDIYGMGIMTGLGRALTVAKAAPAADVVEVKHGKWKKSGNEKTCSACKFIYYSNNDDFNYCPNCGAKMDGERQ